jgi:hypothetical protein
MRLAGQKKMGFYPAPKEAVAEAIKYLRPPRCGTSIALDPCAGNGDALAQLCDMLGMKPYAIELDESRAVACHERFDVHGSVLAPASFFGCAVSQSSFSLAWVNPPYDDEIGGGLRTELSFLQRATGLLKPGGVMCFVAPERIIKSRDVRGFLSIWFTRLSMLPFPAPQRKYEEAIVFGVKRSRAAEFSISAMLDACVAMQKPPDAAMPYDIPPADAPRVWRKVELTDSEIEEEFSRSGLLSVLDAPPEQPLLAPPLPLGAGHLAVLLAAGHLDGIVRPDNEPPHVVRGTAQKVMCTVSQDEVDCKDGSVVSTTVRREKIMLVVRVAEQDGKITTLQE